ncbi:hypothetical protein [Pseudoalteromonas denitrificans]|uniref:Transmembrane anchor protein n=1 Tax=Pseudoalteromonas denitrificans DSM 6059 TaxID=1123010 RepID=A0A1I1N8F2_9GAMM|nr:hypothetical protein [Pseudoalteromonas denitrificans]SFC91748.1 hypothetical protein SAMN02745724_02906 [Pseudoalteromonas denitrificans DSM 6059]
MNTFNIPVHSTKTLIKASLIAATIASLVLIICILPSEYNIDPTGLGNKMGLTKLAQQTHGTTSAIEKAESNSIALKSDKVEIEIPANRGLEYKLLMEKYAHLEYQWQTNGKPLYFDFHGEPKGDTTGYFESFSITTSDNMKGSLTTPFAGSHGWYWKNTTDEPVTVTLTIKGNYLIKG